MIRADLIATGLDGILPLSKNSQMPGELLLGVQELPNSNLVGRKRLIEAFRLTL
jgi:hypothetical protein